MDIRDLLESDRDVAEMQPDTPITVFHGTDVSHALEFCINGIDARQRHHRLYPHWDQGEYVSRGIFVTTNIKVAIKFGQIILKFTVLSEEPLSPIPLADIPRNADKFGASIIPSPFDLGPVSICWLQGTNSKPCFAVWSVRAPSRKSIWLGMTRMAISAVDVMTNTRRQCPRRNSSKSSRSEAKNAHIN